VRTARISPDGTRVAYVVGKELFIRSLDALESRKIAENDGSGGYPIFWAPDGQSLGYATVKGEIKRVDLDGGGATTLITRPTLMQNVEWGDDGFIYFIEFQGGVSRVPDSGGAAETVFKRHDSMIDYHGMALLPNGKGVVTIPHLTDGGPNKIFVNLPGREALTVHESDSALNSVIYSPSGHLLFERDEDPTGLWALPFSTATYEATGAPFLVVPDLRSASFSSSGDMVYTRSALRGNNREQRIVWVDRTGQVVDRLDLPVYEAGRPVPSPDGKRLALVAKGIGRTPTDKANLWVVELARGTAMRLTEEPANRLPPVWSEDGSRIAFAAGGNMGKGQILSVRTDGSGSPEPLSSTEATFFFTLSTDWKHLAVMSGSMEDKTSFDISVETVGDPSSLTPIAAGPGIEGSPAIHPDGKWFAYMAGDIPNFDIYVQHFPSGEGRWKVAGGGMPVWSRDGSRLYYLDAEVGSDGPQRWMEVTFDGSGESPRLGTPVALFDLEDQSNGATPDDQGRFIQLVNEEPADDADKPVTTGMILTENWLARFR
jgi:Tol biopolymer transport system component